jgi:hypothetical protein
MVFVVFLPGICDRTRHSNSAPATPQIARVTKRLGKIKFQIGLGWILDNDLEVTVMIVV